jgi:hypothetical protein
LTNNTDEDEAPLVYTLALVAGMTSCAKKHIDDDGGGDGRKIITLRSIERTIADRQTDSLRFTSRFSLSGTSSMMQEYWRGAEMTSKIVVYNGSGNIAYAKEAVKEDDLICIIQFARTEGKLLRLSSQKDKDIIDTLTVKQIPGLSLSLLSENHYEKGGIDKFEYDAKGNLTKQIEADGRRSIADHHLREGQY